MAIVASWSGAGLADGTPLTTATAGTGDTAFGGAVTSGAFTVDASGLHSPRIQADQAAATDAQLMWNTTVLGTLSTHAVRMYFELSALPPGNGRLIAAHDASNALLWWLDVTSAGILRLRDPGGSAKDTSAAGLPTGTEMRLEVVADGAGAVTATVYTGDGTTPWDTLSGTGFGTTFQQLRVLNPNTSPTWPRLWVDEIAVSDTAVEIGPVASPIPSGGGTLAATATLTGSGVKTGIGGGTLAATATLTGSAGTKSTSGGGTLTATATLTGSGRDTSPTPPRFPLDDWYELLLDGTWTDITGYVLERDPVEITRGRSAEATEADPCSMSLSLDNRDGRFSWRNPSGPWYGLLGRNTQIRASLPAPAGYLRLRSTGLGARMTCPSTTALNVTDLDVRIDLDAESWGPGGDGNVCGKYDAASDDCSWFLDMTGEHLALVWSPTGADADRLEALTTVPIPTSRRRVALRVTLDVDNGAGGWTATFYEADTIEGPWRQLGDEVTGTGTTSIAASAAPLEIGNLSTIAGTGPDGRAWAFEMYDGIDGTLVAAPDLDAQTPGAASFTDAKGNTWTVGAGVALDNRDYRFYGEVSSWPVTWSKDGVNNFATIKASGIKRRLRQNAPPARSPMYREFANPARTHIVAYWPLEDGQNSTQLAAAGNPMTPPMTVSGSPNLAAYSDWTASDPIPEMGTGMITGTTPGHDITGQISVRLFVFVREYPSSETSLLHLTCVGGTIRTWDVRLTTTGALRTRAYDADGSSLLDSTLAIDMKARGFTQVDLEVSQDGSAADWGTLVLDFSAGDRINAGISVPQDTGTLTGRTVGAVDRITVGRDRGLGSVVVGHLAYADDLDAYAGTTNAIVAQNGENPSTRMSRLCDEEEIPFTQVTHGRIGNFVLLGDQRNKTFVELLQEAADTDLGILYEPRDAIGFAYRSRTSLYSQEPAVTLDWSSGQVVGDLVPLDDDRSTVNALTVERIDGSSVFVEQTTGPAATGDPPNGVGRYPGDASVSLVDDRPLQDHAGWRLHLGTVDEPRFPTLTVNLRAPGISDELAEQIRALDVGDRIVLTGMPQNDRPDDLSLLVQGYAETLRIMEHEITFNLAPESPWHVATVDADEYARIDSESSTLAADATADATTLSVATTGVEWTTDVDDFPFEVMVAGELVRVTAISGSTSPQTFTVVRSLNGVVKAQSAGAEVRLPTPVYVGL